MLIFSVNHKTDNDRNLIEHLLDVDLVTHSQASRGDTMGLHSSSNGGLQRKYEQEALKKVEQEKLCMQLEEADKYQMAKKGLAMAAKAVGMDLGFSPEAHNVLFPSQVIQAGDLECEVCNKTFSSTVKLRRHVHTHQKTSPYECGICTKQFVSMKGLKDHLDWCSKGKEGKKYKCSNCNKGYTSEKTPESTCPEHTSKGWTGIPVSVLWGKGI